MMLPMLFYSDKCLSERYISLLSKICTEDMVLYLDIIGLMVFSINASPAAFMKTVISMVLFSLETMASRRVCGVPWAKSGIGM